MIVFFEREEIPSAFSFKCSKKRCRNLNNVSREEKLKPNFAK